MYIMEMEQSVFTGFRKACQYYSTIRCMEEAGDHYLGKF